MGRIWGNVGLSNNLQLPAIRDGGRGSRVDRSNFTNVVSLVLRLSYKEVKEVISSKSIIIGGLLINTIKTVGIDS